MDVFLALRNDDFVAFQFFVERVVAATRLLLLGRRFFAR